jgi:NitT/TauT family transport system substrate-binding protein
MLKHLIAILGFIAALQVPHAKAADKVVLLLNWYVYGEHAPFYLGRERGLFAAEGIDLDIQEGRGSGVVTQAVAAGSVPFGYVDVPTMMRAAIKGAPVIATGVLVQVNPMSAMGFSDKNIRTPDQIRGRIVATSPGDSLSQIWPLFLKRTGLKESDFTTVSGDAQTKLNAVINGRADLLLGYVMDQSMRIKDATGKDVFPIRFADFGINLVSSGIVTRPAMLQENPDLVRRFMRAATRAVELAEREPGPAAQSILNANPKGGKLDTLTEGFQLTIPLYRLPGATHRPFLVNDNLMRDSVALMVEYGGLDAAATGKLTSFYTNAFLPGAAEK